MNASCRDTFLASGQHARFQAERLDYLLGPHALLDGSEHIGYALMATMLVLR